MRPNDAFEIQEQERNLLDDPVDINDKEFILCFKVNKSLFGIDFEKIHEIVDYFSPVEYPLKVDKHVGIINLRGNVVPIVDPFKDEIDKTQPSKLKMVIIETDLGNMVGIIVSDVRKIDVSKEEIDGVEEEKVISLSDEPIRYLKVSTLLKGYKELHHDIS